MYLKDKRIYLTSLFMLWTFCRMFLLLILQKLSADMVDDEAFFDLLSKFQSRRIDDQRCSFRPQGAVGGAVAPPSQAAAAASGRQAMQTFIVHDLKIILLLL